MRIKKNGQWADASNSNGKYEKRNEYGSGVGKRAFGIIWINSLTPGDYIEGASLERLWKDDGCGGIWAVCISE